MELNHPILSLTSRVEQVQEHNSQQIMARVAAVEIAETTGKEAVREVAGGLAE